MDILTRLEDPTDAFYSALDRYEQRFVTLGHFPLLSDLVERVCSDEGVAKWILSRPEDAWVKEENIVVRKRWETVYSLEMERKRKM